MKTIVLLTAIFIGSSWSTTAPAQKYVALDGSKATALQDDEKQSLQLSISILDRRFCSSSNLRLILQLRYTNKGKQPLILNKDSRAISNYMVSRNLTEAAAGRYEQNVQQSIILFEKKTSLEDIKLDDSFVILAPDDSYETETFIHVTNIAEDENEATDELHSGDHVIQVKVLTSTFSQELSAELRRRWQSSGYLWSAPVTSTPASFRIEKLRPVIECS
jgi:hypothetical protein